MEGGSPNLGGFPERNLGGLLNETFSVYARNFKEFIGLVAVVQVPVSLITALVVLVTDTGLFSFVVSAVLNTFALVLLHGAVGFGVGQHYLVGNINIKSSYVRDWWRIKSLSRLALGVAPPLLLLLLLLLVLAIPVVVLLALPVLAIILEGHKASKALQRTGELISGSIGRVLGISAVVGLVALGLTIVLFLPFFIASFVLSPEQDLSTTGTGVLVIGSIVVALSVNPVVSIAGTLIYYDLRVRKENYDLNLLSEEMGIAVA